MSTWEVIKTVLKGASLYKKKVLIFIIIAVIGAIGYFLWASFSQPKAEYSNLNPEEFYQVSSNTMDIVVQKNGQVLIDGKKRRNVFHFYNEYDELRILVFDSPGDYISQFTATVHLPEEFSEDSVRQIVYAVHGVGATQNYVADSKTLIYQARDISPGATYTIVANLPKGMIQPGFFANLAIKIKNIPVNGWLYVAIILPSVTLIIMLFMILKRRTAQMLPIRGLLGGPPEEIAPAIPGVLIDGTVGAREVAATLIDLARRGYIIIVNKGDGQFSFGIRRSGDFATMSGLTLFERELLSKIFLPKVIKSTVADVEMRIGRHIFSRKIAKFYLEIYNEATKAGYFVQNPAKVHLAWKYAGIGLFFLSFAGFMFGALTGADPKLGLIFWVGGMLAAVVIIRLSPFMPARTSEGNSQLREWLEFREFLTDKRPATGVEAQQGKFEQFLPYAIVLGAEVNWAKRFLKEPFTKPEWYETSEPSVTLDTFSNAIFPLIGYVAENLARSHEPTVE